VATTSPSSQVQFDSKKVQQARFRVVLSGEQSLSSAGEVEQRDALILVGFCPAFGVARFRAGSGSVPRATGSHSLEEGGFDQPSSLSTYIALMRSAAA